MTNAYSSTTKQRVLPLKFAHLRAVTGNWSIESHLMQLNHSCCLLTECLRSRSVRLGTLAV